jgi:carbamoyl-phosphate synthase large subunit
MKKKLMIVGAGENQVPIITLANQKGYYTIVVSIDGDYPGFHICDQAYRIDVREKEHILEIARKENICGILTDQTDIPIPTVSYIAEQMCLPGIGYDCALSFTNKYIMRQCCDKTGIHALKYCQASSFDEANSFADRIQFPLIVKPVDSQGSRGVSKVDHYDEFKKKFNAAKTFSATGFVILEEFFQGREIVVEGFVSDFRVSNLIIGDSYDFDIPDMFIPKQRIFPTLLNDDLKQKILTLNSYLISNLKLKFGITHAEYLINENTGQICLIEIAARGGGVFISSDLIPLGCGIDANDLLIKLVTGDKIELDEQKIQEAGSGYICFYLPEGTIRNIKGLEEITDLPGVHKAFLNNMEVGRQTVKMKDKTMRLGPILIAGKNRQAVNETIERVKETLIVEVETEEGIKGIIW